MPKHANGHARTHSDVQSIQVNEAATEPAHVSVKVGKKGRTGKTAAAVPAPEKTKRQKKEKVV
ncbi:MAG: hypothetical protein ACTHJZ_19485, partial [Trinickia sp.]